MGLLGIIAFFTLGNILYRITRISIIYAASILIFRPWPADVMIIKTTCYKAQYRLKGESQAPAESG